MKSNITHDSDSELSILFNKDEALYTMYMRAVRLNDWSSVVEIADEYFIYTDSQLDELRNNFEQEVIENEQ